jgi:hypothetical protein
VEISMVFSLSSNLAMAVMVSHNPKTYPVLSVEMSMVFSLSSNLAMAVMVSSASRFLLNSRLSSTDFVNFNGGLGMCKLAALLRKKNQKDTLAFLVVIWCTLIALSINVTAVQMHVPVHHPNYNIDCNYFKVKKRPPKVHKIQFC